MSERVKIWLIEIGGNGFTDICDHIRIKGKNLDYYLIDPPEETKIEIYCQNCQEKLIIVVAPQEKTVLSRLKRFRNRRGRF